MKPSLILLIFPFGPVTPCVISVAPAAAYSGNFNCLGTGIPMRDGPHVYKVPFRNNSDMLQRRPTQLPWKPPRFRAAIQLTGLNDKLTRDSG